MKNFYTLIAVMTCLYVQAQEQAAFKVLYHFEHVIDTNNPSFRYKEEFALYYGTYASRFTSERRRIQDSIRDARIAAYSAGKTDVVELQTRPYSKEEIYWDQRLKAMVKVAELSLVKYGINQEIKNIAWQLLPGPAKQVAGYTCRSARGMLGGRVYTVWFAPSLKGAYGPWKLQGLPGVILEAEDERKEVVFKAVSILALSPLEEIRLPSDLVVATQQQFDRYKASADKSRAGGSTTGVSISNVKLDGGTAPNQPKIKFNNPLEKQ